jgi:hypothetical protein
MKVRKVMTAVALTVAAIGGGVAAVPSPAQAADGCAIDQAESFHQKWGRQYNVMTWEWGRRKGHHIEGPVERKVFRRTVCGDLETLVFTGPGWFEKLPEQDGGYENLGFIAGAGGGIFKPHANRWEFLPTNAHD